MFHDITTSTKKNFRITTPGIHVYYFTDKSADLSFTVAHSDARVFVYGLYLGKTDEKFSLITRQRHTVPDAQSHIVIKGVFEGSSSLSYEGLIKLEKKASGTDASLESRNLMLSKNAHVSARPQLEILPADVRCTHAATISHLNHEHIDILKMRGIEQGDAEKLLTDGFVEDLYIQLHEKAPKAEISRTPSQS